MPDFEHQADLPADKSHLSVSPAGDADADAAGGAVAPKPGPKRKTLSLDDYARGVIAGDRAVLARAITLIESRRPDDRRKACDLLHRLMPRTGNALRIGITGAPGVGKSTFIDRFGMDRVAEGIRPAVLAVDPSSSVTGGSVLGDKTRMAKLGREAAAFVRPSPAGRTLGGVAQATREAMLLCEAAGFDLIVVETVGVGQSETVVADMTDVFLALMLPGAGDELQGIKRGLIELADVIAINKADGDRLHAAKRSAGEYASAVRVLQPRHPDWRTPVLTCSAATGDGLADVWRSLTGFRDTLAGDDSLASKRRAQSLRWMWSQVEDRLRERLRADPGVANVAAELETAVATGQTPATVAAGRLIEAFLSSRGRD